MTFEVEDFSDLKKVSTEKLLKLRDVANDNYNEAHRHMTKALLHLWSIKDELELRKNAEKTI
ncbi:hypothetical protein [Salmonella phage PVPSE1]|uniref:Uncharacterized protein 5 n=3 Tax=Seunavirus TaxID=1914851 RepID=G3BLM1_9CAUD|nr:hypothetical protein PVP-SE1_gp005 [Salmonella phage PVPSE1]YP_009148878.1 hypothetical protein ACQ19_gp082 [Salmonella phage SSE121]ADP02401.1 hypothetical protein [Salmonella phage PVPSE1]AFU63723.1 hypothetical protein [Salmonella phage SSE121]QXL90596.1 hypothetical protein [Salmonella phage NINP13076]